LRAELDAIAQAHGDEAIAAIRAADVERMIRALAGEGDDRARAQAVGAFRRSLERWGAIDGDRRVAPEIVVRALFAARWNAVHGRALTEGLGPVHLRAYHGWLALEADTAPSAMRERAIDAYREAGGAWADEARGVLAWRGGAFDEAASAFARAHEESGVVRLRNHALAAALAASAITD
nr:hypothetical protein [Myxococcota bacterium]